MINLTGKAALVTGASRGIGKSIAIALHGAGASVAVCARSAAPLDALAHELGPRCRAHVLNVEDPAAVEAVVDQVAADFGGLHIAVNNAGVIKHGPTPRVSDEDFDAVINSNLSGTFYVSRAALRYMPDHAGGRIINIASVLGIFGVPDDAAYVSAKHGVIGLTRSLALELAPKGITVNAICPGWTQSDMADASVGYLADVWGVSLEESRKRCTNMMPIGRMLLPGEIAAGVLYLASEAGAGITAQAIRIDGGQTPF